MKKKIQKKVVAILLMSTVLLGQSGKLTYGDVVQPLATTNYAYSIGVNHGTTNSGDTGDFTANVIYAKTCYSHLSNVASYQMLQPTRYTIKAANAGGHRLIASKIVFLNGHGTYERMRFNYNNNGGDYDTGVCNTIDTTSDVGLASTDMSTCTLISFVGCKTADTDYSNNITKVAVNQGAKVAVGFKEEISSRTDSGVNWLKMYNAALSTGLTVSQSIRKAVDTHPESNLSQYVNLGGNPTNTVGTPASTTSAAAILSNDTSSYTANIDISDIEDVADDDATNNCYQDMVERLSEIDSNFDASDYKVTVNRYYADANSGVVIFLYYINGEIKTNKAYVCTVDNNVVTEITTVEYDTEALAASTRSTILSENQIQTLVDEYKRNNQAVNLARSQSEETSKDIYKVVEDFTYNYSTNSLIYEKTSFYRDDENGGVIGDIYYSDTLY